MTEERITEILKDQDIEVSWEGDNFAQGLLIIMKYFNVSEKCIVEGADHDVIYSVFISILAESDITEEDVLALRKLNWMEQDGALACFV